MVLVLLLEICFTTSGRVCECLSILFIMKRHFIHFHIQVCFISPLLRYNFIIFVNNLCANYVPTMPNYLCDFASFFRSTFSDTLSELLLMVLYVSNEQ